MTNPAIEIDHDDPFGLDANDAGSDIDLVEYGEHAASAFYEGIQNASNRTDRSKQQQDYRLGVSNLGHCRNYAALMVKQTPFSDQTDKTAAFFGTIAGDAIEQQLKKDHPEWLIQEKLVFPIPSGGEVPGTGDIIIPWDASASVDEYLASKEEGYDGPKLYVQGVWDGKSKAELETIRRYGPNQQQIFQIHAYTKAAIEKGLLNPDEPILLGDVFFDRSGRDTVPYGVFHLYREDVIQQIDEWVGDVTYAVMNGEDAARDMPREWCWSYCEYATVCRGNDTDAEGLIESKDILNAVEMYVEGGELEKAGKKLKDAAKLHLGGVSGSTGTHTVRAVEVEPVEIAAFTRKGYTKIDVRKVPGPKKKAAAK